MLDEQICTSKMLLIENERQKDDDRYYNPEEEDPRQLTFNFKD